MKMDTKQHRKISLRSDDSKKDKDTGLTTGSSESYNNEIPKTIKRRRTQNISENESFSKQAKQHHENKEVQTVQVLNSDVSIQTEPFTEESLIQTEQIEHENVQEVQLITEPSPPQEFLLFEENTPQSVEQTEEAVKTPEDHLEHVKIPKNIAQGYRLNERLKILRAAGKIKKRQTKSQKAGLLFPVNRLLNKMKNLYPRMRIYKVAAVYMTAVVEFAVAELLQISGDMTFSLNRKRITPRHVFLAIKDDPEFNELCEEVQLSESGVLPMNIPPPNNTPRKKKVSKTPMPPTKLQTEQGLQPTEIPCTSSKVFEEKRPGYERAEEMLRVHEADKTEETEMSDDSNQSSTKKRKLSKEDYKKLKHDKGKRLAQYNQAKKRKNSMASTSNEEDHKPNKNLKHDSIRTFHDSRSESDDLTYESDGNSISDATTAKTLKSTDDYSSTNDEQSKNIMIPGVASTFRTSSLIRQASYHFEYREE